MIIYSITPHYCP